MDIELLAIRFVDSGHPEARVGPRYRLWLRSNAREPSLPEFTVSLLAGTETRPRAGEPQVGCRIAGLRQRETRCFDLRLPFESLVTSIGPDGEPRPIPYIHVLLDSGGALPETIRENNGASLPRGTIPPLDPTLFATAPPRPVLGGSAVIAGEGLGPAPGAVLLSAEGLEYHLPVLRWSELGVQVAIPELPLRSETRADLVLVRRDGIASQPLPVVVRPPAIAPPSRNGAGG